MGASRRSCTEATGATPQEKWQKIYGTTAYGNLGQYKKNEHTGHIFAPCPYSTQADTVRVRILLGLSSTAPLPSRVSHTDGDGRLYYMKTQGKDSVWGFECTFDNCPYFLTNGVRFFYV